MRPHENPFRSERLQSVAYRLAGGDWEGLMQQAGTPGVRAAIVGPHGTGKTTLLGEMRKRLSAAGRETKRCELNSQNKARALRHIQALCKGLRGPELLLVDGAEQLRWWQWQYFLLLSRRASGVLITATQPGLLPTLVTTEASPVLLKDIAHELLEGATDIAGLQLDELYERHQGNVREALRELYDRYAVL